MPLDLPNLFRRYADFMETPDFEANSWQTAHGTGKTVNQVSADIALALHTVANQIGCNLMEPTEHMQPWDREWLVKMGFTVFGGNEDEMAVEVEGGCKESHEQNHLIICLEDRLAVVECSDTKLERSIEALDLGKRETKGGIRLLCKALGKELPR